MENTSTTELDYAAFETRLGVLLPKEYEDRYDEIQPVSMGSAGLRYGADGRVAWDSIWRSFCDLAMAGGPPHRGTFLEPGSKAEIDAEPGRYEEVVKELCRGLEMVTGLFVDDSPFPGWVRLYCSNGCMAGWLTRALVTENISASYRGAVVYLPAGPSYRIEKEIKNVITAVAKSCHYWVEHMSPQQHWEIAQLFASMERESPLLQPPLFEPALHAERQRALEDKIAESMEAAIGVRCSRSERGGWVGLECSGVPAAVWVLRLLIVSNVLTRREGTRVFVPVNSLTDAEGERLLRTVSRVFRCARERAIL